MTDIEKFRAMVQAAYVREAFIRLRNKVLAWLVWNVGVVLTATIFYLGVTEVQHMPTVA